MKNFLKILPFLAFPFILQSQIYFEPLAGPTGSKSYSAFKDANQILYAKTGFFIGYQKSYDDGENWEALTINDTIVPYTVIADHTGNLFGRRTGIIYRSLDAGDSWFPIFSHETSSDWEISVSPDNILFINDGAELYRSENLGDTWVFMDSISILHPISWHPNGSMYSTSNYSLYKSENGGYDWEMIYEDLPFLSVFSTPIHVSKNGNLYVRGKSPFDITDYYVSTDGGLTFDQMSILQSIGTEQGYLTSNTSGYLIYSNTKDVFISTDNGDNWMDISNGIPDEAHIVYINIDDDQYIYLNLSNDVMYKSILPSDQIVTPIIETTSNPFFKTYPNPFSKKIIIESKGHSQQRLLFDLIEFSGATVYSTEFLGGKTELSLPYLPSGIYFYEIKSDNKLIATGKIIAE